MTRSAEYSKYLFGTKGKRLEELAIFEIGGLSGPIIKSLPQRKAKKTVYKGIDACAYPFRFGTSSPVDPEGYRDISRQMLREHRSSVAKGIDELIVRWNGQDVPYPFDDHVFDEFHSHMVTASLVSPTPSYQPTPEGFADEVNRMLKPNGRVYISTDLPHFFPRPWEAGSNQRAELADRLVRRLINNGFSINVLDISKNLKDDLQGKDYGVQIDKPDLYALKPFTNFAFSAHVDFTLIGAKE